MTFDLPNLEKRSRLLTMTKLIVLLLQGHWPSAYEKFATELKAILATSSSSSSSNYISSALKKSKKMIMEHQKVSALTASAKTLPRSDLREDEQEGEEKEIDYF